MNQQLLEQVARTLARTDSHENILATSDESELHHVSDSGWRDWLPHAKALVSDGHVAPPAEGKPAIIDEMHTALAEMHDSMARAREMIADVPGNSLDEALTNYIGSYMALQVEVQELRSRSPAASGVLEALVLAEDVLSRAPFSTAIWPNGVHPQSGITKIRNAIASLNSQPETNEKCGGCHSEWIDANTLSVTLCAKHAVTRKTTEEPRG